MKKYFIRITLRELRNEEWFTFMTEFKRFIETFGAEVMGVGELFILFTTLWQRADVALEKIRKSALTEVISQLDSQRDNAFRALKSLWKSNLFNPKHELRDAALAIEPVFKHYGNVAQKTYNDETSAIINFIQELREKHSSEITMLGLNAIIDDLEKANSNFEETIISRNTETADKPDVKVLEVRRETDHCYQEIIDTIEAKIFLEKKEAYYEMFIKTLNTNIERYKRSKRSPKNDEFED